MAVLMISINKHNQPKMLASVIQDSGPLLCPVDRPMHVTMQSSSKFGVGSHTKIYEQKWYNHKTCSARSFSTVSSDS